MGLLLDLNQLVSDAVESDLLMPNQKQKLMLIMVMVDTDVMDMVDTDTDVDTDMEDKDTISARDLLMPKPSHTTVITVTHMPMDITHMAFIMLPSCPSCKGWCCWTPHWHLFCCTKPTRTPRKAIC